MSTNEPVKPYACSVPRTGCEVGEAGAETHVNGVVFRSLEMSSLDDLEQAVLSVLLSTLVDVGESYCASTPPLLRPPVWPPTMRALWIGVRQADVSRWSGLSFARLKTVARPMLTAVQAGAHLGGVGATVKVLSQGDGQWHPARILEAPCTKVHGEPLLRICFAGGDPSRHAAKVPLYFVRPLSKSDAGTRHLHVPDGRMKADGADNECAGEDESHHLVALAKSKLGLDRTERADAVRARWRLAHAPDGNWRPKMASIGRRCHSLCSRGRPSPWFLRSSDLLSTSHRFDLSVSTMLLAFARLLP